MLVCRDLRDSKDVIYFTYDLLGGYLIAKAIIKKEKADIESFINNRETEAILFSDDRDKLHPLYYDISRSLAALIPIETGKYLHNIIENPNAFDLAINALFELQPDKIDGTCIQMVTKLFEDYPENRKILLERSAPTMTFIKHPLNMSFWSERLLKLPMPERDISWSEYIRENRNEIETNILRFEEYCKHETALSAEYTKLMSEYTMWLLTSTIRPLRDQATRALYWFGRRMPKSLLDLTITALDINDPYVPERMLSAMYGVAMARQFDFNDHTFTGESLSIYGRRLYDEIISLDAKHSTTHILSRDYSRWTIEIALIHHPDLLNEEEKTRIKPPFRDGGIRRWGESIDKDQGKYRGGNSPIQMTF